VARTDGAVDARAQQARNQQFEKFFGKQLEITDDLDQLIAIMPAEVRETCQRIVKAMIKFPEMIGGTKDRLDTELIRAGGGRLISKIGAEGVYTVGVLPSRDWPEGIGLALKVEDGDDRRARPPAVIDALRQLGVLADSDLQTLSSYSPAIIRNRRGDQVGEARAAFTLQIK
jgi:L-asparaginase II